MPRTTKCSIHYNKRAIRDKSRQPNCFASIRREEDRGSYLIDEKIEGMYSCQTGGAMTISHFSMPI